MRSISACTLKHQRSRSPLRKLACLALSLLLCAPGGALASNVGTELSIGIVSTKTMEIRPLAPLERDMSSLYALVYESLVTIDDDYRPQALLCEYWEESGNGKTWTFHLRSGITFSDGTPLTANDVAATAQFILDQANNEENTDKGYYGNLRYFVDSVTAQDDLTVVVKAASGRAYYGLLYAMTFPILPADRVGEAAPPGTGPFVISDFMPQDYMWLTVNTKWWKQAPQVQQIMATCYKSNQEIIDSYEYAQVDAVFTRSVAAAQYKSGTNSLRLDYRSRQLETLLMNHSSYPLESLKIRQAIRYAINVDQIATQVYLNMVSRTDTPLIGGNWLYSDTSGAYGYDVEKAKALLAEEGWKDLDGNGTLDKPTDEGKIKHLVLGLHVYEDSDNSVRVAAAQMIQDMLAQVGISVHVETESFADVSTALSAGSFDLALVAYQMDVVPDPGFLLMSGNTGNYSRYKSTEMNDLFKTLRGQEKPEDFAKTLADIQQKFAQDCPFMCLFYRNGSVLTHRMYTTARDVRELELLRGIESFAQ